MSSTPPTDDAAIVHLQVGDKVFVTTMMTLKASPVLAAKFSPRWIPSKSSFNESVLATKEPSTYFGIPDRSKDKKAPTSLFGCSTSAAVTKPAEVPPRRPDRADDKSLAEPRFTFLNSPAATNPPKLFLDADPQVFCHVLEYLRQNRYPLLWDEERGFDEFKYADILQMARYYGLRELVEWINAKKFKQVVKQQLSFQCLDANHEFVVLAGTPFEADRAFDTSRLGIVPGNLIYADDARKRLHLTREATAYTSRNYAAGELPKQHRVLQVSCKSIVDFNALNA